ETLLPGLPFGALRLTSKPPNPSSWLLGRLLSQHVNPHPSGKPDMLKPAVAPTILKANEPPFPSWNVGFMVTATPMVVPTPPDPLRVSAMVPYPSGAGGSAGLPTASVKLAVSAV